MGNCGLRASCASRLRRRVAGPISRYMRPLACPSDLAKTPKSDRKMSGGRSWWPWRAPRLCRNDKSRSLRANRDTVRLHSIWRVHHGRERMPRAKPCPYSPNAGINYAVSLRKELAALCGGSIRPCSRARSGRAPSLETDAWAASPDVAVSSGYLHFAVDFALCDAEHMAPYSGRRSSAMKGHSITRPTLSTIDLRFAGNTALVSRFATDSRRSKLRRARPIRADRWCASRSVDRTRPRNIARIRFYSMLSGFRFLPWAVSGRPWMR